MKTGEDIKNRALQILGYTNSAGRTDAQLYEDIHTRALAFVNQIYADVWYALHDGDQSKEYADLVSLSGKLDLPDRVASEVMTYGVAMLMAQSQSDGDNQLLYADLFNQKRALLTRMCHRRDVLPRAL